MTVYVTPVLYISLTPEKTRKEADTSDKIRGYVMLLLNLGLGDLNRDLSTRETAALWYRADDPSSMSTVNMIRCYNETLDNRDCTYDVFSFMR